MNDAFLLTSNDVTSGGGGEGGVLFGVPAIYDRDCSF